MLGKSSLDLFARFLKENSSRYEEEARALLRDGELEKNFNGVVVVHYLSNGGSGYKISNQGPSSFEDSFFQKLDDDPEYNLKILVDQFAQSEVDAIFLISS